MNILITGKDGFIGRHLSVGVPFKDEMTYNRLLEQTEGVEGIIHLAAKSNKRICEENPIGCVNSNLVCLCDVLEAALRRKIWVLFISTFAVTDGSLYGLTKLLGEVLCGIYRKKGLRVSVLRLPIVYGSGDRQDKIVNRFITAMRRGDEPVITSTHRFPFAYVCDVASALEVKAENLIGINERYYTLRELKDGIKECLKEKATTRS